MGVQVRRLSDQGVEVAVLVWVLGSDALQLIVLLDEDVAQRMQGA